MVGEHLGEALITLLRSMRELRSTGIDNLEDLTNYMDEEGYLDFRCQPPHAIAVLHVSEAFKLRNLYIDAFAHCCGMSEQLHLVPEYKVVFSEAMYRIGPLTLCSCSLRPPATRSVGLGLIWA